MSIAMLTSIDEMYPKDITEEMANEEQALFEKIEKAMKFHLQITGYNVDIKDDVSLEKSVDVLKIKSEKTQRK